MTTSKIKAFAKNQEISTRSVCDNNCIFKAKVLSRTAKFVTVKVEGYKEPKRCKISIFDEVEVIWPLGSYSMAPIMRAA